MNLKDKIRNRIERLLQFKEVAAKGSPPEVNANREQEIQFLESLLKEQEKPEHVGTWVFCINNNELTKHGKDGDCKHPLPPNGPEVLAEAEHLAENADNVYIANVFSNGQIKTFTLE